MIWYNLKIGMRHFNSQKNISLINLLGLAIGMSIAILILYYVNFEMSYDNFHKNSNLIYRIIIVGKGNGGEYRSSFTALPMPEAVRSEIKDAEMITGLTNFLRADEPVQIANQTYFNLTGYAADNYFLKMFNFPLILGNPNTVFDDPGSMIITQSTAKKLFPNENPLGKVVIIDKLNFTVTGVLKDIPENSIFSFNLLVSHLILKKQHPDLSSLWWYMGTMTFVKIYPKQSIRSIKTALGSMPDKYFPDFLKGRQTFDIQQLNNIHLDNLVLGDTKPPVSSSYFYILMAIAGGVLFISCANYANLSTSLSEKRTRETGIRKLSGGGRLQITSLFISEAVTISIIALGIAIFLAEMFLPWFNELSQRNLTINFANRKIFLLIAIFGILTGTLSGIYPALLFSKFTPVQMFRSRITTPGNKIGFRKGFIIAQFLIAILLITSQLVITKQVLFMKNHNLGFNEEDLISIPIYSYDEDKRLTFAKLFKECIEHEATTYGIKGLSLSENVPGQNFPNGFAVIPEGSSPEDLKEMVVTSIDGRFSDIFQVPVVSGRNFSDSIASDRFQNVLINETAALKFGWDNPIGKKARFKHEEQSFTIIGVLKDINFKSLQINIEQQVYRYAGANWLINYITIRADRNNYLQSVKFIKTTWEKLAPGVPFQYFFIKDKYLEKYTGEERLSKIIGTFAIIAIFLSCLGLYSMITYLATRRTKEIGIRKINGAGVYEVLMMLNKDFIKLVTIAYVIAIPIAWISMHKWLENFAYKTELSWWIFAISGLLTLSIALLTVSFQSWRAATRNPVEALRYE
jgi:putative ABC transport system permease protein